MTINERQELYDKAKTVKKFAEKDGQVFTDFEGASILNSVNAEEPKTGLQTRNKDNSLASTGKTVHAINPNYFYANRYKVKGTGANRRMYVVSGHTNDGYRCIKEQASGTVFLKNIPAYVIAKVEGEYILEKVTTITDKEFISDYTEKLSNPLMAKILPLIAEHSGEVTATNEMPI